MDNPWATDDHHWPEHADALNAWTTSYNGDSSPTESRPASPAGFGTFESADSTETAWSAPSAPLVDEWELAKRQKLVQDEHAPPELLASILDQLRALSTDLWPEAGSDDGETCQPSNDFLSQVPSLKLAVDKYVPDDLVLSANVQFSRTFTSKHMNEALRLTRHLPMTLSSPMSVYMASKGSTAWEAFVKSRLNISQDDVLLPGWRMVEKTERESTPAPEVKKKTGGGLLSFLGLKGSDTTGAEPHKPSPSSSRPASIVESIKSPRSSLDGSSKPRSERQSSTSQPSTLSTTVTPSSNPSPPGLVTSPHTEQQLTQDAVQPAPSGVARFFGRFSRSSAASSNQAVQSRSHSLALSSDDIEFLTDIVPSANDAVDEDENLKSLMNMISAKTPSSLSATPLPQPLPPPPRSTRHNTSSVPLASDSFSLLDSVVTEQPPTNTASMRSLIPTVPSTNEPASQPTSKLTITPPITVVRPQTRVPVRAPSPQRRNFTAVMGRSTPSSLQGPLPPPPLPPPSSPFRAIPPPQTGPVPQPASLFADDEFSDFLSSPATPNPPSQPSTSGISSSIIGASSSTSSTRSFSSTLSDQSLLQSSSFDFRLDGFANSSKSNSRKSNLQLLDDDFNDFVSSSMTPVRTPPPRPPPKMTLSITAPAPQGLNMMSNRNRESLPPPPPPLKASRAADHSRTSSLVESAAARPGRWPAPPSPLPQIIAPPPPLAAGGPSSSKNHQLGMFDDVGDETLTGGKAQLQKLTNTLWNNSSVSRSGLAAPVTPPPPLRALNPSPMPSKANGFTTGTRITSWSLDANGSKPLAPTKPVTGSSKKTVGGLSAQDLSFFEGL
ncbi:hypothetical protein APHAL10511_004421 [Amanita phalloides]|nr:hypothetical protein APHAL10511_004421 [Amanita phalloides]